jgi:hypothetical protein
MSGDHGFAARALERNERGTESLVTAGARETKRIALLALAECQERTQLGIADQDRDVRFATGAQGRRGDRFAEPLVPGLERFEHAARVVRERVVAERVDRVGQNWVSGTSRART